MRLSPFEHRPCRGGVKRNGVGWDPGPAKGRGGLASLILGTFARTLAQESDRWFLWLPVVFAGGIVTYFALSNEPDGRMAAALLLAAIGRSALVSAMSLRDLPLPAPSSASLRPISARKWFAHWS